MMSGNCTRMRRAVFKGSERIGSLLKIMAASKPWHAYAASDGQCENFKTRKAALDWLADRHGTTTKGETDD